MPHGSLVYCKMYFCSAEKYAQKQNKRNDFYFSETFDKFETETDFFIFNL